MTQDYGKIYHTYPVFSDEDGFEGAVKRFVSSPTPTDLVNHALKGLPKIYPLTGERITIEDVEPYLTSAYSEIEMSMNMDLSPVEHFQSFDFVPDMFSANWSGMKLTRFPATKVLKVALKFPHTQNPDPVVQYIIPSGWIILRSNKLNIAASYGSVVVQQGGSTQGFGALGMFSFLNGYCRDTWQPAVVEVQYQAGWEIDRMPAIVADLILTVASIRMFNDIGPILFPFNSASVSIDAVSQSAQLPGARFLIERIKALELKRKQLEGAITGNLGRTIKMSFIGA